MTLHRTPIPWLAAALLAAGAFGLQAQTSAEPGRPAGTDATRALDALVAAFKRADANQDGRLTREEAARMPAVADRFDDYDKDRDGTLTLEEMKAALVEK